jgi:hypothetical protein
MKKSKLISTRKTHILVSLKQCFSFLNLKFDGSDYEQHKFPLF